MSVSRRHGMGLVIEPGAIQTMTRSFGHERRPGSRVVVSDNTVYFLISRE